jgi:hypothetical protein
MQQHFKKLGQGESLEEKPRSGRPRLLTSTLRRRLGQLKAQEPYKRASYYAAQLARISGGPVSVRSTRRALHQVGYGWRLIPRRRLTSSQKRVRLGFSEDNRDETFAGVWAADECTFNLYGHSRRYWARVSTSDADSKSTLPKLSGAQEKVSPSIVAAISNGRKSALGFLPKNWSGGDLARVFERDVFPSLGWIQRGRQMNRLIWDNDGRHFSAPWKRLETRLQLRPFRPWPANSPDFDPIENAFAWMKDYVEGRQASNEQELRQAIIDAWRDFPLDHTRSLMESLPRRLAECRARKCARTSY